MQAVEENAVVVAQRPEIVIAQKDLDMYRKHFCPEAPDDEWQIFVQKCYLLGLNPMLNEVYLVGRNTRVKDRNGKDVWVKKYATQVSITGLISLAERTHRYEGHTAPEYFDQELNSYPVWPLSKGQHPYAIRIGVYKKGWREPSTVVVYFHERAQYFNKERGELTQQWQTQGIHMHLKCTLAAALRWAFQETCGGVYIHEEMGTADTEGVVSSIVPNVTVTESTNEALKETANRMNAQEEAKVTEQQLSSIHKLCEHLGKSEPEGVTALGYLDAKKLINQLTAEYRESKAQSQQSNVTQETTAKQQVTLASLKSEAVKRGFVSGKTDQELKASWLEQLNQIFDGKVPTEAALSSPANLARINGAIEQHKRAVAK